MQASALAQLLRDIQASAHAMTEASEQTSKALWQTASPGDFHAALEKLEHISAQTLRQVTALEPYIDTVQNHPELETLWQETQYTMQLAKASRQAIEMQIGRAMHANAQLLAALSGTLDTPSPLYNGYGPPPQMTTGRSIARV